VDQILRECAAFTYRGMLPDHKKRLATAIALRDDARVTKPTDDVREALSDGCYNAKTSWIAPKSAAEFVRTLLERPAIMKVLDANLVIDIEENGEVEGAITSIISKMSTTEIATFFPQIHNLHELVISAEEKHAAEVAKRRETQVKNAVKTTNLDLDAMARHLRDAGYTVSLTKKVKKST
jgi:hypothetical protein